MINVDITWEVEPPVFDVKAAENDTSANWDGLFRAAAQAVLDEERIQADAEVELLVVNDETIHEMNVMYRKIDRATDVLSFPMCDFAEGSWEEQDVDPETGALCLGDIVISLERAVAQAREYGHSLEREMAFLTIHSMLHLLGYDHMAEDEERVMIDKQKKVLAKLGL